MMSLRGKRPSPNTLKRGAVQQLWFTMNKKKIEIQCKTTSTGSQGHRMIIHAKKKAGKDRLGSADPNTYGALLQHWRMCIIKNLVKSLQNTCVPL